VTLCSDKDSGPQFQVGHVYFKQRSSAVNAKRDLHGQPLGPGSIMYIDWAAPNFPSIGYMENSLVSDHSKSASTLSIGSSGSTSGGLDTSFSASIPNSNLGCQSTGMLPPSNDSESISDMNSVKLSSLSESSGQKHHQTVYGRGMRSSPRSGWHQDVISLYVRFMTLNSTIKIDESIIFSAFNRFGGNVTSVTIKTKSYDKTGQYYHGYAFVDYEVSHAGRNAALTALAALANAVYCGVQYFTEPSRNFCSLEQTMQNQQQQIQASRSLSPIMSGVYTCSGNNASNEGCTVMPIPILQMQQSSGHQVYYQHPLSLPQGIMFPTNNPSLSATINCDYNHSGYNSYGNNCNGGVMLYPGRDGCFYVCEEAVPNGCYGFDNFTLTPRNVLIPPPEGVPYYYGGTSIMQPQHNQGAPFTYATHVMINSNSNDVIAPGISSDYYQQSQQPQKEQQYSQSSSPLLNSLHENDDKIEPSREDGEADITATSDDM
jgi:hypothetical protein